MYGEEMKVALVTSWHERCGIAAYAENLVRHCPGVEFLIIPREVSIADACNVSNSADIFVLNYEPGILGHWTSEALSKIYVPTVLILHTSHSGHNENNFTSRFRKVVVHEKTQDNFTFIPLGIPDAIISEEKEYEVGTVGFPFPWKGFTQVTEACKILNLKCKIIIPDSRHANAFATMEHLLQVNSQAEIITKWMPEEETIRELSKCKITAFPFHGGNFGISASCRLGLAAGTQLLLSRCRQFNDLFTYEDEIEFVAEPTTSLVAIGITNLLFGNMKKPSRVLKDFSWKKSGELYMKLFEEIRTNG